MTTPHRRLRTASTLLAAGAALVLTLAGCSAGANGAGADSDAEGTTTLKVATIGLLSDGALQLGIEQGFFAEEGLEIETSIVANPPAGLAAAQSGQVDIAYAPSIPLLNALNQGVPLQVVAAADGYAENAAEESDPAEIDDTGLYASPDSGITSIEDLAGATVAVPARQAQLEVTIANAAVDAGVDPATINWVVLDFTSAVSALASGTADAAGLVSPFTGQAAAAGSPVLAYPGLEFFEEGAVGLWTAGESTVAAKADAIAAFQRAIAKTNAYANENSAAAVEAGIAYTESSMAPDEVTVPYWPTEVTDAELSRVNDKLVALGYLPGTVDLDGVILAP
ncbi:ABC transporter substrate-binding protein [Microbacterium hominis]|uniref:ABC transporter substrate-binding protein n=1 Tax=Microbacterium hominis TaxID=162426 RepID=A0A7D4Q2L9_9MICO|nr:ABC transporter substrate-binding protein [Microbacterium hominis]QKJ20472.1 ABC transporter substrate-binding protein [Microbacterium hominis]